MASLGGVALPDDIVWINEDSQSPISHNYQWAANGRLQVSRHKKKAGLKIKIKSQWVTESTIEALKLLRDEDAQMLLQLADGSIFNVMFAQNDNPLDAVPIVLFSVRQANDFFQLEINLITI